MRFKGPLIFVLLLLASLPAGGQEFVNPKANIPPKAKPDRRNAGEGFPPLPLPGTPLRRSEKKREPAPPGLVGNVTFAAPAQKAGTPGWQTTVIDIEKWVEFTNSQLGQKYRYVDTDFSKFSYDPAELPILYFTGWKPIPTFDDQTIAKLRQYLMDGGTWVVHSNCGRPEFNASFRQEIARIFPDRQLVPLSADHPVFRSFYPINSMRARKGAEPWMTLSTDKGLLEGITIGTRLAVIFSPIDLSCGWNAETNPIEGGVLFDQQDALKLGSNIVTYCLAEYQYARAFAHEKIYHQSADATRDQLVIGQLVHNGDWDATPHGLPNLLKSIDQSTTLRVQFKRIAVDPEKDDLASFPVLYLAGQQDFQFSPAARSRLRSYCQQGGTLVVDDVCGSAAFDQAFRREIGQIIPDHALKPLAEDHPMFSFVTDTRHVQLAPLAGKEMGGTQIAPRFEAIVVEGTLQVIYSPLSLSAGWEQLPRAYNRGYADADALRLGTNLFVYLLTH